MSMSKPAEQLNLSINEIQQRGSFTRLEPRAILSESRILLDTEGVKPSFPLVALYCNWCAHDKLERDVALKVLLELTKAINLARKTSTTPDDFQANVCAAFGPSAFLDELRKLFMKYGISTWPIDGGW